MNDLPYRQSVYAYIVNDNNQMLLVLKKNSKMWDFPGGGIDGNETLVEALGRELFEELGVSHYSISLESELTYKYDWPESERRKNFKKNGTWECGQEQHFYIIKPDKNDFKIKLQEEELTEFKWFDFSKIKTVMGYPDQYQHILNVFLEHKIKEILRPTRELQHGEETLQWLLKIEPNASWQLQIAALAHDIDRAVPYDDNKKPNKIIQYDEYKRLHARRSSGIVKQLMEELSFDQKDINKVTNTIENHEIGGDEDSDLVRDADSIRWFVNGYEGYIEEKGLQRAKEKGWWMYKRASESTKELINNINYSRDIKEYIDYKTKDN